jgi:hypothetical protein
MSTSTGCGLPPCGCEPFTIIDYQMVFDGRYFEEVWGEGLELT